MKHSTNEIIARFEKYQIRDVKAVDGWQKVKCPRCSHTRKKSDEACLAINFYEGGVRCHHCGWHLNIWGLSGEKEGVPRFQPVEIYNHREPDDDIKNYLVKARGISISAITRNHIEGAVKSMMDKSGNKTIKKFIAFKYYFASTLAYVKYRSRDKVFLSAKGGTQVFYKINDVFDKDECIITEGEIDALSFETAGYPNAVSIPGGAPNPDDATNGKKFDFLERCLPYMSHIKRYYIAVDNDLNGRYLRKELIRRLGKNRCYVVHFPIDCKDANDVLIKYGKQYLADLILSAEPVTTNGISTLMDYNKEFLELHKQGYAEGVKSNTMLDDYFSFHKGQLSVFTGIPGHGKSNFVDYLTVNISLSNDWKFGLYTPENQKIVIHSQRLAEITIGKSFLPSTTQMSEEEAVRAMEFIDAKFKYLFPEDLTSLDELIEAIDYMAKVYDIDGFIIDPWNTIAHNIPKGDTETIYTAKALNRLKYQARDLNIHTCIIAHPTKMDELPNKQGIYRVPGLYDISGSANWFNVVDNGFTVYRDSYNNTAVFIRKVKHGFMGKLGRVDFKFNKVCQRYYTGMHDEQGNLLIKYNYI